jgi:xylulokinase
MTRYFVGVDVGTTATKAVLLADDGTVLRRVRAPHVAGLPLEPGRVDPVSWWGSVQEACRALQAGHLELDGIGLSVHSPVAVPMDAAGKHVSAGYRFETPGLTDIVKAAASSFTPEEAAGMGNRTFPATFMVASYLLMQEQEPEAAREVDVLGSVGTYIGHKLTGNAALDPSQASYFGAFDVTGTWTWQDNLLHRLGIPPEILPPVRPSLSTLGKLGVEAAAALGLRPGAPVVTGAGDTACAAFAAGIERHNARLFTLGTTHVITEHGDSPVSGGLHLQRAYVRPHQWLRHGVCNGGLSLSVAARTLGYGSGGEAVPALINRAAEADARTIAKAPYFIPHVLAERGPLWIAEPRAGFIGLSANTDETAAAWSAVEGVLFADRLIWESFSDDRDKAVFLAGDVSGGEAFTQLAADMFGAALVVSDESHLPAVGAALLAAEGTGFAPVAKGRPHQTVPPRPGLSSLISERWQGFTEARTQFLAEKGDRGDLLSDVIPVRQR